METIAYSKQKQLSLRDIQEGPCLRVTGDGETIFYLIVNPRQEMRARI